MPCDTLLRLAISLALVLCAGMAHAGTCGDADGSDTVTVTDGVQVLRAAASLQSSCSASVCDVDGNGSITVTDGVGTLRVAASLPTNVRCATVAGEFVSQAGVAGEPALLRTDDPPAPAQGAPTTITGVTGATEVSAGGSNTITVTFNVGGSSAEAGQVTLLIAIQTGGSLGSGFFEHPLTESQGSVQVTVRYPPDLPAGDFMLAFATRDQGVVSTYVFLAQHAGSIPAPTPSRTSTPVVGAPTPTRTSTPGVVVPTPTATPTVNPNPSPTLNAGLFCVQAIPKCFKNAQGGADNTNFQPCPGDQNNPFDSSKCTDPQFPVCHYPQCNIEVDCGSTEACCPQTCDCTGPPAADNLDCPLVP